MVSIKPEDQVITTKSGVTLKLADIDPTFVACLRNKADEVAKIARQLSKKRTREIEDDDEDIIAESAPSVMALSDTDFGTVRLAHALFDFAIANAAAPQTAWKVIEKMCKTWTATIFPKLSTSLLGAHDAHSGEACLLVAIKTAMFNGDLGEPNSLHAKAFSHLCEHLSRIFDDYEFEKHGDCCHEGNGCHSIVLANGAISILSIALRISTEITGDHQRNNDLLNLLTSGDYKSKLPSGETIEEITACVNSTNWVSNAEKEFGKRTSVWMTIISIIASSYKAQIMQQEIDKDTRQQMFTVISKKGKPLLSDHVYELSKECAKTATPLKHAATVIQHLFRQHVQVATKAMGKTIVFGDPSAADEDENEELETLLADIDHGSLTQTTNRYVLLCTFLQMNVAVGDIDVSDTDESNDLVVPDSAALEKRDEIDVENVLKNVKISQPVSKAVRKEIASTLAELGEFVPEDVIRHAACSVEKAQEARRCIEALQHLHEEPLVQNQAANGEFSELQIEPELCALCGISTDQVVEAQKKDPGAGMHLSEYTVHSKEDCKGHDHRVCMFNLSLHAMTAACAPIITEAENDQHLRAITTCHHSVCYGCIVRIGEEIPSNPLDLHTMCGMCANCVVKDCYDPEGDGFKNGEEWINFDQLLQRLPGWMIHDIITDYQNTHDQPHPLKSLLSPHAIEIQIEDDITIKEGIDDNGEPWSYFKIPAENNDERELLAECIRNATGDERSALDIHYAWVGDEPEDPDKDTFEVSASRIKEEEDAEMEDLEQQREETKEEEKEEEEEEEDDSEMDESPDGEAESGSDASDDEFDADSDAESDAESNADSNTRPKKSTKRSAETDSTRDDALIAHLQKLTPEQRAKLFASIQ